LETTRAVQKQSGGYI